MNKQFDSVENIKKAYPTVNGIYIGSSSYNQVIKHAVEIRRFEDSLISVQIGSLIGNTFFIDNAVAEQADSILSKLTKYYESDDQDALLTFSLVITDDGYRLWGELESNILDNSEDEKEAQQAPFFEINNTSLTELIDSIHIQQTGSHI